MFSALKRLTGKTENGIPTTTRGHHTMSHNLQKKFAKGIQYNMKIIIKGDRNTGKTCLFHRLQGKKFVEEYVPTDEIQVASIHWNYKAADDVVKVEVWDVVDRGKKRPPIDGLKLGDVSEGITPALDAEFLDVYKGTNGVILVMDITKSWSFEYVEKELVKIPAHIPVLVLGNHCDMAHHRTVTADRVTYFIESVQRPEGSAQIRYAESSMSNGFGLKLLHKFFCLPFLQLQRESLLQQLQRNQLETQVTLQELDLYQQSDEADYDKFLENLSSRRRQIAEVNAVNAPMISSSQSTQQLGTVRQPGTLAAVLPSHPAAADFAKSRSLSVPEVRLAAPPAQPFKPSGMETKLPNIPDATNGGGFISKIFGKSKDGVEEKSSGNTSGLGTGFESLVASVEEFVPDGGELDKSFLEEPVTQSSANTAVQFRHKESPDSDSEQETGNPLVAGFQDDLDPDDLDVSLCQEHSEQVTSMPFIPPVQSSPEPKEEKATSPVVTITGEALDEWLGGIAGRVSPEGGEDSGPGGADSPDSTATLHSRKSKEKSEKGSKSKHHKKKSSRDKESSLNKEEKKGKKKKSSRRNNGSEGHDELEEFLNSHDTAYEAI